MPRPAVVLCASVAAAILVPGPRPVRSLPNQPRQMSSERPGPAPPVEPPAASPSPLPGIAPRLSSPPAGTGRFGDAAERKQRGVSLGLFAEDVSFDYGPLLQEIAELGASHVALVIPIYQEHAGSVQLALHTRLSPSLSATAEAVRAARRAGLEVMLFPIVRLQAPRGEQEWRGTLAPENLDAWFDSYLDIIGDLAAIGGMTGATRLAIGSELSSLDSDLPRWSRVIERIRSVFPGTLLYSANWDHYREARLLDLVDEAGVVAYFELRARNAPSDLQALERRWRELREEIEEWRGPRGKQPFVFTELGYRSRAGSSAAPWDESTGGEPDLEEQRRAFEAFRRVWAPAVDAALPPGKRLSGLYVWNWYGWGGPASIGYTPRGKPAAQEIRRLLKDL
jgi:hypothetical protein